MSRKLELDLRSKPYLPKGNSGQLSFLNSLEYMFYKRPRKLGGFYMLWGREQVIYLMSFTKLTSYNSADK